MSKGLKIVATVAGWACVAVVPWALGCGQKSPPPTTTPAAATETAPASGAANSAAATAGGAKHAVANVTTTSDGGITGTVSFTQNGNQVEVALDLQHVPPGQHAWHIHEGNSCGREKQADGGIGGPGTAAGNHWNPAKVAHGLPTAAAHHAGDFGNFTADATGKASAKMTTDAFNLDPSGEKSAIGHALIIHGGVDDGTGTNGNAGARIGCGIVEKK